MGPFEVRETADLGIVLSDGTRLSARVWRPVGAGPVPAILEYLPYRKRDGTCARDALTHPYLASHGYACIRVDIRGNGDSQGVMLDEYTETELADGEEVIHWLAAQDWCSGKVGMMGISWGGFNSLQLAARAPEPLKAIITLCSTVDRFADDIHYKGGCLLNENLGWAGTMLSYSSRPPDPALVGDAWRDMWLERLQAQPHLAEDWAAHQTRDGFWQHGSVCEDFSAIRAAVLAVGGWGDAYKNAPAALVAGLDAPVKAIVGPWIHKYPHFAPPEPRIGFLQEALRWWDHWLKGIDTGVDRDAAERLYLMDSVPPQAWYEYRPGRWIDQDSARAPSKVLHLTDAGLTEAPGPVSALVDSPADCGMTGGEYCAIWMGPDLPGDQRRDDAMSTCFDTQPLPQAVEIAGAPEITLTLVPRADLAQIAVRLCDIHPNGASSRITYGVMNLCHHTGAATPGRLTPGTPISVTLKLDQIAYALPEGHRIRVAISNAYWPLIWPSPIAAPLTLTDGRIDIPLVCEGETGPGSFLPPDAAPAWRTKTVREAKNRRETLLDHHSGTTTLTLFDDFGAREDLDHGLMTGSVARETWSIHPDDPLSARGKIHWTQELGRGDWSVRTETFSEMWSDADWLHLTARIEAYEGDDLIFERDFSRKVARDFV